MGRILKPTTIKVVPKDGEIEITLNINITIDGEVSASADNADVSLLKEKEEIKVEDKHFIPTFTSGLKLDFGK